jgi:hypothetical protein
MEQFKFSIIDQAKTKKESVLIQCKCGSYDFVHLNVLQSGDKRSCGKCSFDLTDNEFAIQVDKLFPRKTIKNFINKRLKKQQTTIFD